MLTSLVMVTTCTMAGLHIAYIALWFLFEVFVMYAELERTGRGYFPLPTSKAFGYALWFGVGPLMQNFVRAREAACASSPAVQPAVEGQGGEGACVSSPAVEGQGVEGA
jgi:hypothetical protein